MDKHICTLMFIFLMCIACVVNPRYNINHTLTFRLDFSKTCVTKGSHV